MGSRPLAPGMRRLLLLAALLVGIAGGQLFVFSQDTAVLFAWTLDTPLTAAFLGAAYWASCSLEWLAARQPSWSRARIAVPAVLLFTTLTLLVTLGHLDRFHFTAPDPRTVAATWAWLLVYILVPPLMLILLTRHSRPLFGERGTRQPLPVWLRVAFGIQCLVLLSLGLVLLLAPERASVVWPWSLSILSAQAVGAWLVGLSVTAGHVCFERDVVRVRPACISALVLTVLELIAVARFPGVVDWDRPHAYVFLIGVLSLGSTGAAGLAAGVWTRERTWSRWWYGLRAALARSRTGASGAS
jgi:hypothetical protein